MVIGDWRTRDRHHSPITQPPQAFRLVECHAGDSCELMNPPNEFSPPVAEDLGGEKAARTPGDLHKTITMAQIARAAGVSQGAISSLLNDRDYGIRVSEKTRERVFKVCREMGYIPNDLRAVVRMYPELGDFCLLISSKFGGLTDPARRAGGQCRDAGRVRERAQPYPRALR
jgi:hypothetical protein